MVSESATDSTQAPCIGIAALASYAIAFDEISEEAGARYLAVDFVAWLRLEVGGNDASRGERGPDARASPALVLTAPHHPCRTS